MRKLFFILALLFIGVSTYAQNYQLHSVYIYSFIRYIQWPEDEKAENFVIGVVGDSPLLVHLEKMAEAKKAGNQHIMIKTFKSAEEVSGCKIVFLTRELDDQLHILLKKVKNKSTLIITEKEGLGQKGSNINFVVRDEKLAFELNKAAMDRAALKVSTELARLAIII